MVDHNPSSNPMNFTIELLKGRFFVVFATIIILAFVGTTYIFGLYSNDIKSTLGYDQTTLNLLSFFKDFGAYVSVHVGLLAEVSPPWVVLSLGGVVTFVGYFMIWLSVTHRVARPAVWQMCLYIGIGANSMGFANSGGLVPCVKNFPENRGVVIGLLKGYIGLGGAIMAQLYHALYGNSTNAEGIILLIAVLPAIASILFSFGVRVSRVTGRQVKRERKFFNDALYMGLALAGFIMVMILVQRQVQFSKQGYAATFATIMILLILPIFLVFREEYIISITKNNNNQPKLESNHISELKVAQNEPVPNSKILPGSTPETAVSSENQQPSSWYRNVFSPPSSGDDHTILQATFSIDMMILYLATICGIGGNLTTIDNLGQIGASLGYPKKSIGTFVSLVSIWQYLGRVMGGFVSESLLRKYKFSRPFCLTLILLISCIGHLLIAFDAPYGLYVASIILGFCFGAEWTYLFTIISELFGLKYYATLYNYGSLAAPLGSYIFNVRVAGHLYDREGTRQLEALGLTRTPGKELVCTGVKCYQLAYIIIAAATFFTAVVSLILVARTRKFYQGDIYKKFQDGENELPSINGKTLDKNGDEMEIK